MLIFAVLIGLSNVVLAAGEKTPIRRAMPQQSVPRQAAGGFSSGKTLVFSGLLLAGAIVVRRVVQCRQKRRENAGPHGCIAVLSRQLIDDELTIRILQVGTRILVVGSTAQGLVTLMECSNPEEIAAITGNERPVDSGAGGGTLFMGQTEIRPVAARSQRRDTQVASVSATARTIPAEPISRYAN